MDITILGGRNGDIPLEHTAGKLIAKTLVETGMSAILDVSLFSKPKQRRFVTDFAEAMLEFRKRDPAAMHIFWEEAYRFMPQRMAKGTKNEMLEATEELVTMGRNFGIGGTIITVRSALVSKTVLSQASVLIAMNTTGKGDKKTIMDWMQVKEIDHNSEILVSLSELKKGEAYIWWPEEFGVKKVQIDKKKTYNASATPKFGEKTHHRKLKAIDLEALEASMVETIEKAKAEDPKLLQRKLQAAERDVARLEREQHRLDVELIRAKRETKEKVVEVPVIRDSTLDQLDKIVGSLSKIIDDISSASLATQKARHRFSVAPVKPSVQIKSKPQPQPSSSVVDSEDVSKPEQRILDAIAWMESVGVTQPKSTAVALLAQYRPTSGGFGNLKAKLRAKGLIKYAPGKRLFFTEEGRTLASPPNGPTTTEELHRQVLQRLSVPEGRVLQPLLDAWPNGVSSDELANAAGYSPSSGGFGNLKSKLRTLEIIDYPERGWIRACDLLFLT